MHDDSLVNLTALLQGEEKDAEDRRLIHQQFRTAKNYIHTLAQLIQNGQCLSVATWLLKAALAENGIIKETKITEIYKCLGKLGQWQQKLRILQCIEYMLIAVENKNRVEKFLRDYLCEDNKFVRAWAYNGFYYLAMQHHEFREEVTQFFSMALRDEAASVKARVRHLIKKGF